MIAMCRSVSTYFILCVTLFTAGPVLSAQPLGLSERAQSAVERLESGDAAAQRRALLQLEALRESGAGPAVEPYLRASDDGVRAYAYRCLIALRGQDAVTRLIEDYATDSSERVQRAILFGLEPYSSVDARIEPLYIGALTARSTEVRMAAVDVVSRLGTPEARAAIEHRASREWRRDVKRVLKLALERLGSAE